MTLSDREKEIYSRQLLVPEWDQEKLKGAKAVIVGMGGIGSSSSLYLTAAGIGKLRLCDGDRIERSDLNRQILFNGKSVGKLKVNEAMQRLISLNPYVEIETISDFMNEQNAERIVKDSDIIIDGLDNNESRFTLNKLSVSNQIPYVYGAVHGWEGFVGLFNPPHTACLACFLDRDVQKVDVIPVSGLLPGIIGLIQASEAVKFLMGIERNLEGHLFVYDSQNLTFDIIEIEKNSNCPFCST